MFYTIEKLAELTGTTRRTIRYYIQRGLLQKPTGAGRGSRYTDEHLQRIRQLKAWQEQGTPLERMKALLAGKPESFELREAAAAYPVSAPRSVSPYYSVASEAWTRRHLTPDIELMVRGAALSARDLDAIGEFVRLRLLRSAFEYGD